MKGTPRPIRTSTKAEQSPSTRLQDRGAYDLGFKEGQGFLAARGGTYDFTAGVLHGKRQVQGYERLILGHED